MRDDNAALYQPEQNKHQPMPYLGPITKPLTIIAALTIAVISGTGGYMLGTRIGKSIAPMQPTRSIPIPTISQPPSPSPTSTLDPSLNWKTYKNTKYGYSIKYPQDWLILVDLYG